MVLGAGGVLGAAWMVGALLAVEEVHGVDVRDSDELLGTSAGSVLAALLACGVSVPQLARHQRGEAVVDGPLAGHPWDHATATGGALPQRPLVRLGAGGMLVRNVRRIRHMPATTVLAALAPVGRGSLDEVGALVAAVTPASGWPTRPGLGVVALDYDTGRRVAFGRPGAPAAELARAVQASCAIPGWYAPQAIGAHRYVDGGSCSPASADLLAGMDLEEVVVLAPMTAFGRRSTRLSTPDVIGHLERRWRTATTRRVLREAEKLQAQGTRVTVLGPGPEDLEAIGTNVMDTSRRLEVLSTALRTQRAVLAAGRSLSGGAHGAGAS